MTIKQSGGVFGRNPTFNNVDIVGTLSVNQILENVSGSGTTLNGVTLKNGNVIVASGKGIDFSATPGTGTSELLADYEEGIHSATATCSTSGTISLQGNTSLSYTKIGDVVHVQGYLYVGSVSSPVGAIRISLPFIATDLTGASGSAASSVWITNSVTTNVANFVSKITEATAYIEIGLGNSTSVQSTSAQEMKASSQIWVSATYKASY